MIGCGLEPQEPKREMRKTMKNFAMLSVAALCLAVIAPAASAQATTPAENTDTRNHGNLGAYLNYTHLHGPGLNMLGVGGRIGFNVRKKIVLEAEMAYDFERTQTQSITVGSVANSVRTNVRVLHFLFGPKIQTTGPIRFFALAKAGVVNFGVGGPATAGAINNQIGNIIDGDKNMAIYPGGGVEINRGKWGIRAEAGDELIWLRDGVHNNVRVAVGPQLRF
jgi:opacity protein-like surface antigen